MNDFLRENGFLDFQDALEDIIDFSAYGAEGRPTPFN